jgi:DNA-binding transcriptional LysR family regulator
MNQTNVNRADLNLLVVFDAVARTRSVTAAADELALSQPAVSHALRRLREMLGDPLFVRGRQGLTMTARAEGCAGEIDTILAAVGRVLGDSAFDPATTKRIFKFAASDYAIQTIMPQIAKRLRRDAGGSVIEVSSMDASVEDKLRSGRLDIAFVGEPMIDKAILTRELFREKFTGLVCSTHPLAIRRKAKNKVTLSEYLAFPHVAVSFGGSGRSPIDAALSALGKERHVAMVTPSFSTNLSSVQNTDLIVSLPSRLVGIGQQFGLVTFKLPMAVPDFPYLMAWHIRTNRDPALTWLRAVVVEEIRISGSAPSWR